TFRRRKLQRLGFLSLGPVASKFLERLQSPGGDFATREQVNRDVLVQLLKFADVRSLQSSAALASGTALVVLDLVDEDLRHRSLALPQLGEVPARLHLGGRLSKRDEVECRLRRIPNQRCQAVYLLSKLLQRAFDRDWLLELA